MKIIKLTHLHWMAGSLAAALVFISSAPNTRANVYATDINLNGSLSSWVTNHVPTPANPVAISYRINDSSAANATVTILNGSATVATISGGYAFGLNTVLWGGTNNAGAPVSAGVAYTVSITAMASGYPFWTQISFDANAGNYAFYPHGLAVDCNTNSPYYGRVVMGNSYEGGANPVTGAYNYDGIYKMNADGTFADEGGFGYGGYTTDDGFDAAVQPGEMPSGSFVVPWRLRIGADDKIYMLDYSYEGAVSSFDMTVTSNFVTVIDEGIEGYLSTIDSTNSYATCDDFSDLNFGIGNFDVMADAKGNGAVMLCNNDFPNWGIWMFHLTNGASDPNDTEGTQAVFAGSGSDLFLVSSGGCMLDTNLDIFCSQSREAANLVDDTMVFSNWNGGILPPEHGSFTYAEFTSAWADATTSTNYFVWEAIEDTVINSRIQPTLVALPGGTGNDVAGNGINVINATDGSFVSVTNGGTIQTLTNLDYPNIYTSAAWDNVGNLYAASTSTNRWRVWSPPGANTNTTVAIEQVIIPLINITGATLTPSAGCSTVTINFTAAPAALPVTGFTLVGSSAVSGPYAPVSGGTVTLLSPGVYQATATVCSGTQFFEINY